MRSFLSGVACLAAVASVAPSPAAAQAYPTKPITLISPFAAGGTSNTVSRAIGKQMADRLGQPVIVANRTGAGGTIGLSAAAKSAPDGYTIVMGGLGQSVFAAGVYPKLNYDPQADLVPIAAVATVPTVIAVRPTLEVSSLAELIALAKRKPDSLKYGSAGVGGTLHIAGELFERETGTRLVHVPYRGGAPAMTDLLGGQIDLVFADVALVTLPSTPARCQQSGGERNPLSVLTVGTNDQGERFSEGHDGYLVRPIRARRDPSTDHAAATRGGCRRDDCA